ncbi:hypothetical protein [Luteimonas saliphila]|uniref:hypothetical protein n=1 Tax=Luteimonas saliphila TaxID=2804919 RepID=UPI00192E1949|nr:hypothetical protein [Luteimonas saliphila]
MNTGVPPVDLDDALAVVGYGADALDQALEARLADALDHAPAAALVTRLEELRRAMLADDPRASRRGIGLLGRLLGRDVHAETEAAHLRDRLGVLLAQADREAGALRDRSVAQHALQAEVGEAVARIGARIASARTWLDAHPDAGATQGIVASTRQRLQQRLQQLDTVQASWSIGADQLALLRDQTLDLLARYQRIRDVLLPAWRQHALGDAARAGGRRAIAAADVQAAIESEVAAMAGTLDPRPAPPQARE